MCSTSIASPCNWFLLCFLEPQSVYHSFRGSRQHERIVQIALTQSVCVCFVVCICRPWHVSFTDTHLCPSAHFAIYHSFVPWYFEDSSPQSPGTFCRCVSHFPPACFTDLPLHIPWHSLQEYTHVPAAHLPQTCCVSSDPHLT